MVPRVISRCPIFFFRRASAVSDTCQARVHVRHLSDTARSVCSDCQCSLTIPFEEKIWLLLLFTQLRWLNQGFSVLPRDVPWDVESTWSTFAAYFFILHVPLSFGVLPMIARILHQSIHDPVITAASALTLQATELAGFLALLYHTANNRNKLPSFFLGTSDSEQRNWLKASALGIGFLILLVLLTSILADRLIGPKDINNPILKEILFYSPISKSTCFFLYCFVTPLLEESVYRGFLLTSIASGRKVWQAISISSFAFSLAHFSLENSLQLFIIGCVLGSVYSWSGKLAASITVHSVYNAIILLFISIS